MPRIFKHLEAGCLQVNLMSTSAQINKLKYTILYYTLFIRWNISKMMKQRLSHNKRISGAIQPYMFEPRAADSDSMSAEADHDEQTQNADHPVHILLW